MKEACKYNIIRFQPYVETQEFANIGIVLFAPASRTFVFKLLQPNHYGRITTFFDTLDKFVFQESIKIIKAELERIQALLPTLAKPDALYDELVRPREDILRYSAHRVMFTEAPDLTATQLFEHYVHRSFTREHGHEEQMQQHIENLLKANQLSQRFKDRKIGKRHYEVRLPFVTEQPVPAIIKPIHFRHSQSKQLMDHGLQWLATMEQLYRIKATTPEQTLFAYKAPDYEDGVLHDAFEDIRGQIKDRGIQMLAIDEQEQIAAFARHVAA